ncbi:hypothetical protein DSM112329_04115 [Paraconexibacter sp. AEG42_29]|uniref:PepSY domain-containing protein n=1 Tax=Paraconexibacter sp. AEG42_29 TaxID=2997339 RepID=A0AAU7B0X8_9ACTN
MGRRDAFGNEIDDDAPDGGTGASASVSGRSGGGTRDPFGGAPDPFGAPPDPFTGASGPFSGAPGPSAGDLRPPLPPPPPGRPGRPAPGPRRRGLVSPALGVLLTVGVVMAAVFGITALVDEASDRVQDTRRAITTGFGSFTVPSLPALPPAAPSARESPAAPQTPPVGFGKGSLLLKSNFADALRILRAEGARARTLRVAADRIDGILVTPDGRQKIVQVTWQGRRTVLGTVPAGPPGPGLIRLDSLVRSAPFRLARSAAERAGRPVSSVDYVVALGILPGQVWSLFLKDGGGHYTGDRDGRITRKVS